MIRIKYKKGIAPIDYMPNDIYMHFRYENLLKDIIYYMDERNNYTVLLFLL